MTDAPERTYRSDWLGPGNYSEGVNLWSGPSTEYVRADLHAAVVDSAWPVKRLIEMTKMSA